MTVDSAVLKRQVQDYWNAAPCGTEAARGTKYTREYFDAIEEHRYRTEPEVLQFAQFTRFHGKRVLEIGLGSGTDFIQWARAGARAQGIDLTPESVEHVRRRLAVYGLNNAEANVGDCENLPYPADTFDLVYSFGVLHHTPDTERAITEAVRVLRPGGTGKLMLYNRYSIVALVVWLRHALLTGRPWRSLSDCIYHHVESIGTKAYTKHEVLEILRPLPIRDIEIETRLTYYDRLEFFGKPLLSAAARTLANLFGGDRLGWFMLIEFKKAG